MPDFWTITLSLFSGGLAGALSPIWITWIKHNHEKKMLFRNERKAAYIDILPRIVSSYSDERKLGEHNKIEIDKVCPELYLLAREDVYRKVKEFNKLCSIEVEEFFKPFSKGYFSSKEREELGPDINQLITNSLVQSEEISKLKEEIILSMRKDIMVK